jgi:hypothetical protein
MYYVFRNTLEPLRASSNLIKDIKIGLYKLIIVSDSNKSRDETLFFQHPIKLYR